MKRMLMKRWISCLLILALCLPGMQIFAAAGAIGVEVDGESNVWTLENDVIRTKIEFTAEGGIKITSFYNKRANREYLPQGEIPNLSSLFKYDYRLLEPEQTGKEPVGEVSTLDANGGGLTLGNPNVVDIQMTSERGVVSTIGKRLEIPVSKDDLAITLSFEIYDDQAGLKYQAYLRNNNEEKRLQITSSDVLRLDLPDEPRNLHYACIMQWYSTTAGVDASNCKKVSEDIKVIINLYNSGDGFYIGPEVNGKTQSYRREPGTTDNTEYMAKAFAGISAFKGNQVTVATNPESLKLVLFPEEEFEYIAVNVTAFTGDIVDAKMAVEEHLRTRFQYNHTSTILNTNDWEWGSHKRNDRYYRETAVPIAKRAGFDMVMFDDGWNNADSIGTSRDGVAPLPSYLLELDSMEELADYYKAEELIFGLWYSLSGGYHNRGNDLADPAIIEAKQDKIQYMIDNYHLVHHMIDLTQFWLNDAVTDYSHPTDNVYRKNVLSKNMLNEIVDENPQYKVKYTTEVDIWPSQGDRSNELMHVIKNGWTTSSTELGENLDVHLFAGLFGHLPLNSVYFNSGNMSTGNMANFYKYMFSRNVKHGHAPDTWSESNIALAAKFNEWRKSERIRNLTDTIVRPVYAGQGWDSSVAANWSQNAGPYVLMHVSEDKSQALMLATGGGKPGPSTVDVNLRWLDPAKSYLIEDITLDDTGIVTYRFNGLLTGDELKSFVIDLDENTSKGKAYWIEEFRGEDYQILYADEKVDSASLTMNESQLSIQAVGKADTEGKIIVYGKEENGAMVVDANFDAAGYAEIAIDEFESSDDVFIPSLPAQAAYLAFNLFDQDKIAVSGGAATKVAGGTTPNTSQYGVNFTSATTEAGSYIEFSVKVVKAGVYNVQVASKVSTSRGIGQWYIDGVRTGPVWDQREAEKIKFFDLGIVTFETPGDKIFRFQFEGGSNRVINTDRIVITPVLTVPAPTYEAEEARSISTSEGTSSGIVNDADASGGRSIVGYMTGEGDSISITFDIAQAGTYEIAALHKIHQGRAIAQLSINDVAVGQPFDQYGGIVEFRDHVYGSYTFEEPGPYTFKFEVTGKNEQSNAYNLSIDAILLLDSSPGLVINGDTTVDIGNQITLTAEVAGLAPLYRTADYVRWTIAEQQPASGSGRVISVVPNGLNSIVHGVNPGTAVLKAMSTVTAEAVGTVTITVTGVIVAPPQITSVTFEGQGVVGQLLTANVAFTQGDYDANADDFEYEWRRSGVPIAGATSKSYMPTEADLGSEIRVSVIPIDVIGSRGAFAESAPVFVTAGEPAADLPQALNVRVATAANNIRVNQTVTAAYDYYHEEDEAEQGTTVQWYTVEDTSLSGKQLIVGATGLSLTPTSGMVGSYLLVEVTPRTETAVGLTASALSAGPVLGAYINPNPGTGWIPIPLPEPEAEQEEEQPTEEQAFPGFANEEVLVAQSGVGLNKKRDVAFISGYPDRTFRPDRAVTREEALTMLFNLVVNSDKQSVDSAALPYKDVKPDAYSLHAIAYFTEKGIVSGMGADLFAPAKPMTRAEFAKLMSAFLPEAAAASAPVFKDTLGHWAENEIRQLAAEGLMIGFGNETFRPDEELTRAQIVAVICRLLGRAQAVGSVSPGFTDLPAHHWAYGYIVEASQ